MTNDFEDFDQEGGVPEELPPPRSSLRDNLTEAWRTRPIFKLLVLMTVVAAVIAASIGLFSTSQPPAPSRIARPPDINVPAGGKGSPYFNEQVQEANRQREQNAIATGGSAIPTPVGTSSDVNELGNGAQSNDPLNELRNEVQHLNEQVQRQQVQQTQQAQAPQQQQQPQQFDNTLAQAMQQEMQQMMDSWTPHGVKQVAVSKLDRNGGEGQGAQGPGGNEAAGISAKAAGTGSITPISASGESAPALVPAGTVSYAQLLTEANSDVPGPILAQIMSGPLSGARAVGQFQTMNDYLVLTFTLVSFKGKDYQINAIALDPNTTLGGMATEVDERWFSRVLLPAAAGFMQGFGSALSAGSSSVVTNGTTTIVQQSGRGFDQGLFQGLSQAGQTLGQFFSNEANQVKPLVRVAAGTPMGLFFVSSVKDTNNTGTYNPYGYGAYNAIPGTAPANVPYPYAAYPNATAPYAGSPYPAASYPYQGVAGSPYAPAVPYATAPSTAIYPSAPAGTVIVPSGIGTTTITH